MPHLNGLKAFQYFLNNCTALYPPTDTLIRLAELVTNKNMFSFKGEAFSQMNGIAMGKKMGPSYTHLFMGHWTMLQHYSKPVLEMYKRYTDDGIGATSVSHSQLLDFMEFVQNFHPAVKFMYEISEQSVAFLDMDISPKLGKLTASIHYKATNSHSYLDHHSLHNPSMENSIPPSQFLRLRRLCSDHSKAMPCITKSWWSWWSNMLWSIVSKAADKSKRLISCNLVSWCFTPSQLVRLYQGDQKNEQRNISST